MKIVYEASSSIEAHMVMHLLEREGISSNIDGEYLQGGIGELQASGLVHVRVEEKKFNKAKEIASTWEKKQPKQTITKPVTKKDTLLSGVIGFIAGVSLILFLYNTPTTSDEIDNNDDGITDEWYIYTNDRLSKVKSDRNFDGDVDRIYNYDRYEIVKSMRLDDDFNGTLETLVLFKDGNPISSSVDTIGDNFKDYRESYTDGIIDTITLFNAQTENPVKVMKYKLNKLVSSKFDSNGDGIFDIEYSYNLFEEIKDRREI